MKSMVACPHMWAGDSKTQINNVKKKITNNDRVSRSTYLV